MTWRLATSFVLTAEMRLSTEGSGEDSILAVGVSRQERVGLVQRIRRRDPLTLTSPEWLTAEQIDETYSSLLPSRKSERPVRSRNSHRSLVRTGRWRRSG